MIKRVCERCGNLSDGRKIYTGRTIATDILLWRGNWTTKKIEVCYECWKEFVKWMDN